MLAAIMPTCSGIAPTPSVETSCPLILQDALEMVERVMGLLLAPVVHRSPEGSRCPVKLGLAKLSDNRDLSLTPSDNDSCSVLCS